MLLVWQDMMVTEVERKKMIGQVAIKIVLMKFCLMYILTALQQKSFS